MILKNMLPAVGKLEESRDLLEGYLEEGEEIEELCEAVEKRCRVLEEAFRGLEGEL